MSNRVLDVWIPGRPRPQGKLQTFAVAGKAYGRHTDSTLYHRAHVISTLAENWGREPLTGPVRVSAVFTFARPKSHYGTGRNCDRLKDSAPEFHTQPADVDKLARLLLDSLEMAGVVRNDSQVWTLDAVKMWGRDDSTHVIVNFPRG